MKTQPPGMPAIEPSRSTFLLNLYCIVFTNSNATRTLRLAQETAKNEGRDLPEHAAFRRSDLRDLELNWISLSLFPFEVSNNSLAVETLLSAPWLDLKWFIAAAPPKLLSPRSYSPIPPSVRIEPAAALVGRLVNRTGW